MILLREAIETAVVEFVARHTDVRPKLKPSKKAHLASGSFLQTDAEATAKALSLHAADCTLFGVPLLAEVRAENGWLLFFFTADVIDAYAKTLPPAEEPDASFFSRRLWIMVHHADADTPNDPYVLDGFYAALFLAPQGERRLLRAAHHLDGNARVALEQRLRRIAAVLLWERRNEQ